MPPLSQMELTKLLADASRKAAQTQAPPYATTVKQPEEDGPGFFMSALNFINRPNSAIMGLLSGNGDGTDRFWEGLRGEETYSGSDVLESVGGASDSAVTKGLGLFLDVINPLDPTTYVGFGLNKAGKIAQAGGKAVGAAEDLARAGEFGLKLTEGSKLPGKALKSSVGVDRVAAAERGLWSPITFGGASLVPREVATQVAKVVQPVANFISQNPGSQFARGLFGGMRDEFGVAAKIRELAFAKDKGSEEILTGLRGLLDDPSITKEERRIVTLAIEDPSLLKQLQEQAEVTVQAPKVPTPEEIAEGRKGQTEVANANLDAQRAYATVMSHELDGLNSAVDAWQYDGKYRLQSVEEAALGLGYDRGTESYLDEVFSGQRKADEIAASIPGGRVVGFVTADIADKSGMSGNKAYSAFKQGLKGSEFQYGVEFPSQLMGPGKGSDVFAIVETQSDLADDIADIGGANRTLDQRKATVKRAIEGIRSFIASGKNPWDREGMKKMLRNKFNVTDVTADKILDAVTARIATGQAKGMYTRWGAEMVDWARHMEDYSKLLIDDAIDASSDEHVVKMAAKRWKTGQDYLAKEIASVEQQAQKLTQRFATVVPTDISKAVTPMGPDDIMGRADYLKELSEHLQVKQIFDTSDMAPDEIALLEKQMQLVEDEIAAIHSGKWTLADAAATGAGFSAHRAYYEDNIAALMKRLDDLRETMDNPDIFERNAAILEDLKAQSVGKNIPPTKPITINGAQVVVTPGVQKMLDIVRPMHKQINDVYLSRGVPKEALPYGENYMPHMFKRKVYRLFGAKAAKPDGITVQDLTKRLTEDYYNEAINAGQVPNAKIIQGLVEKDVKQFLGFRTISAKGDDFSNLLGKRTYDAPIHVINLGDFGFTFEDDAAVLFGEYSNEAFNWAYAFDLNKWAVEKWGKSQGELIAAHGKVPGDWVPVEFANKVPAADKWDHPFKDMYIPAELQKQIGQHLYGARAIVSNEHIAKILEVGMKVRNWISATTLSPWPAFHARNLVGDILLNKLGGLDVLTPHGMASYMQAGDMVFAKSKEGAFASLLGNLRAGFAQRGDMAALTPETMKEFMQKERILGSVQRDLESHVMDKMAELGYTPSKSSKALKAANMVNFFSPKGGPAKLGYKIGGKVQDFGHAALFIDRLKWHANNTQIPLEDAMKEAAAWTRKHLFDYSDLTPFERYGMKNLFPFYSFTAKNIPLQLEKLITEPGKFAYLNRAYNGLWSQYKELEHEDVPEWMKNNLGAPIRRKTGANGEITYDIFSPMGWVPMADINELAGIFRGEPGRILLAKMNPVLKEPLEQLLNKDFYRQEEINKGQLEDIAGIPMNPKVAHFFNNFRFVTELDRLNPGGIFTKLGKSMGWFKDERPNRREVDESLRWTRGLTGFSTYTATPEKDLTIAIQKLNKEIDLDKWKSRKAMQRGSIAEAGNYRERAMENVNKKRELALRLQASRQTRQELAAR